MFKYYICLFFLLILSSCGGGGDDSPVSSTNPERITRINSIEGEIYQVIASEDSFDVEIGPIKKTDGSNVDSSIEFELKSITGDIQVSSSDSDFQSTKRIMADDDGILRFKAKAPVLAGTYNLSIEGKNIDSPSGVLFVQVNHDRAEDLGEVSTNAFKDQPPYDGEKSEIEEFAVLNEGETFVTIGPVRDRFGNLVRDGYVGVILVNGFLSDRLDEFGNPIQQGDFDIVDGFIRFTVNAGQLGQDSVPMDIEYEIENYDENGVKTQYKRQIETDLPVLESRLNFTGNLDFGTVYLGFSKEEEFLIENLGNTVFTDMNFSIEEPFFINGGTCLDVDKLGEDESCTLKINFVSDSRSNITNFLRINVNSSGNDIPELVYPIQAFSALPPTIFLTDNLIAFDDQVVGETAIKTITAINQGDVPANNVRFNQPIPYLGQESSFYVIRSPDPLEPNDDDSAGNHCGSVFQPGERCKLIIEYTPLAEVGNQQQPGSILADDADPVIFFTRGESFVNNFNQNIPVVGDKASINKDEADTLSVTVGPILTKEGSIAPENTRVEITMFRVTEDVQGVEQEVYVGRFFHPNPIIGAFPYVNIVETNAAGLINFTMTSALSDSVGDFTIRARIVSQGRILAEGSSNFFYDGAKLEFAENPISLGQVVLNQEVKKDIIIANNGTLDALNISYRFRDDFFTISDEKSCVGLTSGTLSLNAGQSCTAEIYFNPTNKQRFSDELILETNSIASIDNLIIFAQGINPGTLNTESLGFNETFALEGDPISRQFFIANIGDEDVNNITIESTIENSAFTFNYDCEDVLEPGRVCSVQFDYQPVNAIPFSVLNTEIIAQGIGSQSGFNTSLSLPVEILHSSMFFVDPDPGININDCYALQVNAKEIDNNPLDFTQSILLSLSSSGAGNFYSDDSCSTEITTTGIPANEFLSPVFYYKPTEPGVQVVRADTDTIASAIQSFTIYKEPHSLEIVAGNNQLGFTDELFGQTLVMKVVDEDGNGVPNVPVELNFLDTIDNAVDLLSNSRFVSNLNNWSTTGIARWSRNYDTTAEIISIDSVSSIRSESITLSSGLQYILNATLKNRIGIRDLSGMVVSIKDNDTNATLASTTLDRAGTIGIPFRSNGETIYIEIRTTGAGLGVTINVDNVHLFPIPALFNTGSPNRGELITDQNSFFQNSTFEGPGFIKFGFKGPVNPNIINIRASSDAVLSTPDEIYFTQTAELPTQIQGVLGDLVVAQGGFTLIKDGVDNSSALFDLGASWNSSNRALTLRGQQIYDFNSIAVENGANLYIDAQRSHGWTQLLSKTNCEISGTIQSYNGQTNGSYQTYSTRSIDNEDLFYEMAAYSAVGGRGGRGGHGASSISRTTDNAPGSNGTIWSGGRGGEGAFCPAYPGWPRGPGNPGAKGSDGTGLFLKCFNNLNGANGRIIVSGNTGGGASGSYDGRNTYNPGNNTGYCITAGSGGSGGGPGGNGGKIIIAYGRLINQLNTFYGRGIGALGRGGTSGASGRRYYTYQQACKGCGLAWTSEGVSSTGGLGGGKGGNGRDGSCFFVELTRGIIKRDLTPCSSW